MVENKKREGFNMIKIEYIMTKNMVENILKKNVSLYTNKILLIFILIFTAL